MEFNNQTCSRITNFLNAVKYGTRKWLIPMKQITDVQLEKHQSYFVPLNCDILMLPYFKMCHALNAYKHVHLYGDSLTQHTMQGMYIALSNDLILGGIITDNLPTYQQCRCDEQFSEHLGCRKNGGYFLKNEHPQRVGLCSSLDSTLFSLTFHYQLYDYSSIKCDKDSRPVFVLLQGGVHYQSSSETTIKAICTQFFNHINVKHCYDEGKIHAVWVNYNAQSRT